MRYGLSFISAMHSILIILLIIISFIDLKHKIIPDGLNLVGIVIGVALIIYEKASVSDSLIGLAAGAGIFSIIAITTNAMGGGDIKLMAVLGFIFGVKGVLFITLFSFVSGAVISAILLSLKVKNRKDEISFGPFISFSAVLYIIYGSEIINWYLKTLF